MLFPEGKLTADGEISEFKGGLTRILEETPVPVEGETYIVQEGDIPLTIAEQFGITVEEEEMVPENLDSVDLIVAYLSRKRCAGT